MCFLSPQVLTKPNFWVGTVQLGSTAENQSFSCFNARKGLEKNGHFPDNASSATSVAITSLQVLEDASNSFAVVHGRCINRYCKEMDPFRMVVHNTSGDLVDAIAGKTVIGANKCSSQREGLLCGQCKKGFSLTPYYKVGKL